MDICGQCLTHWSVVLLTSVLKPSKCNKSCHSLKLPLSNEPPWNHVSKSLITNHNLFLLSTNIVLKIHVLDMSCTTMALSHVYNTLFQGSTIISSSISFYPHAGRVVTLPDLYVYWRTDLHIHIPKTLILTCGPGMCVWNECYIYTCSWYGDSMLRPRNMHIRFLAYRQSSKWTLKEGQVSCIDGFAALAAVPSS